MVGRWWGAAPAVLALGMAIAAGPAWAGPHRQAVLDLLNAYEHVATEAELRAIGEGVDAELMAIAEDAAVPLTRRGRAVSALQYFRTDAVRSFLETKVSAGDALVRRKAAYSLAAFGAPAVGPLTAALGDADVQLRIAAAAALGTVGGEAALQVLRDRLAAESEPAVRDALTKAIGGTR